MANRKLTLKEAHSKALLWDLALFSIDIFRPQMRRYSVQEIAQITVNPQTLVLLFSTDCILCFSVIILISCFCFSTAAVF